jgi:plasmid replication initiation protein
MAKPKKKPVQLMLPKNIGAIQISNDLTLIERKIMNIILYNSFNIERNNFSENKTINKNNKKFYSINIHDIENSLGWERGKHRFELKQSLDKLVSTSLKFNILKKQNTDSGKWNVTASLLSAVITDEDESNNEIYYAFSEPIKDLIIKPTLYGWIDLEEQKTIESKYTLALLEYLQGSIAITKRTETRTEYITVDNYKNLIAGDKSNYSTFKDINRFLIKNPLNELNTKTDIIAKASFQKSGRKVVGVSFDVKKEENTTQNQNLELDFHSNNQTAIEHNTQSQSPTENKTHTSPQETRKANELMIKYSISEKKRREYLKTHSSAYIEANIAYFSKQKEWKDKGNIPVGLLIKAIEDNYANYGDEKQEIELRQKYTFELRMILNPFFDKTDSRFLRNIIQDYQIYKERKDKENIKIYGTKLKQTLQRIDFLKQELLKLGYENEQSILNEVKIKTDDDFKEILFYSKEELKIMEEEVGNL